MSLENDQETVEQSEKCAWACHTAYKIGKEFSLCAHSQHINYNNSKRLSESAQPALRVNQSEAVTIVSYVTFLYAHRLSHMSHGTLRSLCMILC